MISYQSRHHSAAKEFATSGVFNLLGMRCWSVHRRSAQLPPSTAAEDPMGLLLTCFGFFDGIGAVPKAAVYYCVV